jgi:hypothetical protein
MYLIGKYNYNILNFQLEIISNLQIYKKNDLKKL